MKIIKRKTKCDWVKEEHKEMKIFLKLHYSFNFYKMSNWLVLWKNKNKLPMFAPNCQVITRTEDLKKH